MILNNSILVLSRYETHFENIYTGLCNIKLDINKIKKRYIHFTQNVSFTTDLDVATEFRGNDGIIIGLNMNRSYNYLTKWFYGCDVSWISDYPGEKEILCGKGSALSIYKQNITIKGNNQYIVCDEGNQQEVSFQNMFARY